MFSQFHHVAIISSDYERSKAFYNGILGFKITAENWQSLRKSWKCDLRSGDARIELFFIPGAPARPSNPEAQGLRHLAFAVSDIANVIAHLERQNIVTEPVRIDPYTGAAYTFFSDPDGLPIEIYEVGQVPSVTGEERA